MALFSTAIFNGIAVGIRLLLGLVTNKFLALTIGPAGFGIVGQLTSLLSIFGVLASGGLANGVVKYTAEHNGNDEYKKRIWATAFCIVGVASILTAIVVAVMASWLSAKVLGDPKEVYSIYLLSGGIVFFGLNSLLTSILNGLKEFKSYIYANIASALATAAITVVMALQYGLRGAVLAVSINQVAMLACTIFFARPFIFGRGIVLKFSTEEAKKLGQYTLMAIVSAICVPVAQTLVRDHLAEVYGWGAVGIWQGLARMSDMYLMLFTSTLSIYYLPRMSEIKTSVELRREIFSAYCMILPFAILASAIFYWSRDWIVVTLFTKEFLPMRDLFLYQCIGDLCKLGTWLLGFVFHARALAKLFILSEILYAAVYYFLVQYLTSVMGMEGVTLAYALSYGVYWIWVGLMLRGQFRS